MQNDLMVVNDLQKALIAEIETLLANLVAVKEELTNQDDSAQLSDYDTQCNNDNKSHHGFKGYAQFLPKLVNNDADPDQFFPYFIVRIDKGATEDADSLWTVTVDILLGVHDADTQNEGHFTVLNAINRIHADMNWALQDEDTWPYFFGGVELRFDVPKPMRKEPNYGYW